MVSALAMTPNRADVSKLRSRAEEERSMVWACFKGLFLRRRCGSDNSSDRRGGRCCGCVVESRSRLKRWSVLKDFAGATAWIAEAGSIAENDDVEVEWLEDGSGVAGD